MPREAAFFDLDHTLIDADAGVMLGLSVGFSEFHKASEYRSKPVRAAYYTYAGGRFAAALAQGALFAGLYKAKIIKRSTHVRLGYRMLKGMKPRDMSARMAAIWDERLKDLFYPEMLALVERHRKEGRRIVVVTTSLRPLVEHARKWLGEVDIIACEPGQADGVYSGDVEGPLYGAQKRESVERFARENDIDLAESWAYSDHWSDVAFLECVGNPVVVNPDLRLALLARRRGWRVLRVALPKSS